MDFRALLQRGLGVLLDGRELMQRDVHRLGAFQHNLAHADDLFGNLLRLEEQHTLGAGIDAVNHVIHRFAQLVDVLTVERDDKTVVQLLEYHSNKLVGIGFVGFDAVVEFVAMTGILAFEKLNLPFRSLLQRVADLVDQREKLVLLGHQEGKNRINRHIPACFYT